MEESKQRLSAGERPEDVFDYCGDFCEGLAWVKLNGKYNYINREGKYLSDTWFDARWGFNDGFAQVELSGKYYHLHNDGVLCDYDTKEPVSEEPASEEPDQLVSLNKVCEYLWNIFQDDDCGIPISDEGIKELIEDFKKAMAE